MTDSVMGSYARRALARSGIQRQVFRSGAPHRKRRRQQRERAPTITKGGGFV